MSFRKKTPEKTPPTPALPLSPNDVMVHYGLSIPAAHSISSDYGLPSRHSMPPIHYVPPPYTAPKSNRINQPLSKENLYKEDRQTYIFHYKI